MIFFAKKTHWPRQLVSVR